MRYLPFCDGLILHSLMSLRVIHGGARQNVLLFWGGITVQYVDDTTLCSSVPPPAASCAAPTFWLIVNNKCCCERGCANGCLSFCFRFLWINTQRGTAESYGEFYFEYFEGPPYCFPRWVHHFTFPPTCARALISPRSHQRLFYLSILRWWVWSGASLWFRRTFP